MKMITTIFPGLFSFLRVVRTQGKLNDESLDRLKIIQIQSRYMSDPTLSDIYFKNKILYRVNS